MNKRQLHIVKVGNGYIVEPASNCMEPQAIALDEQYVFESFDNMVEYLKEEFENE